MKRLREFFEKIAFAGLKPGGQKAQGTQFKWLGPLSGPIERFLSGGAQNDPLYLTNRSTNQKIRTWLLIGIPCLLLLAAIGVMTSNILDPPEAAPVKELTAKEIASKLLPNMDKEIKLTTNPDVQVVEVAVQHGGGNRLVGVVHNNTSHELGEVELVIDVTDNAGSQVGGVSGTVLKVPAKSNKEFQFPIKQKDAAFALVREIISR
uniref:Uncharacterized protein n=1 Tax=Solibacter usitatus (strain Ellin6076) TaxID=234267 RepID=Q023V2_SOLUE